MLFKYIDNKILIQIWYIIGNERNLNIYFLSKHCFSELSFYIYDFLGFKWKKKRKRKTTAGILL